jgi:probable O-glycosylation ligase (exosortase A-associated)
LTACESTAVWWRPETPAAKLDQVGTGGRVAFAALVAFTGILVLSPQVWFPILKSLRIAFLAAGVAILGHLLDRAVRRQPVDPLHPEIGIALLLVGWAILTVPLSYWPGGSVTELSDRFLKAVAFFWLIGTLVTTRERLRLFSWLLVLCSIPLSLTAVQNYQSGAFLTTPNMSVQRIAGYNIGGSGLTANPNDLALMLNLLIPLAIALMISSRGIVARAVAACALLLSAAAVILTFSRAGFLSLAAIGVMSLIAMARRQPVLALGATLLVAISIPPLLPEGYLERLGTITDISSDPTGSAQGRWTDLTVSADLVARNPVTGVGIGQNVLALNQVRGATWREVHNVYLQYAVDLGLPGLFLFLWLFTATFKTARRVRRRASKTPALREVGLVAEGVEIALIAFAIAGFFHPIAYQFYFFCVGGLALAAKNAFRAGLGETHPRPQAA